MTDWREFAIGELGRVVTGKTPPAARPDAFGNEHPFVTPTDMVDQRFIAATERCLSADGAELLRRLRVPSGALIVSCIGWQLGKVAISTADSFTNQQINTIIPNDSKVDPLFLYYHLRTRREELKRLASGGTRTPILNKSRFEALKINLPSRFYQERVVAVIGSIDDLIENNLRRVELLEEMARAVYREWFVKFRYPGHRAVPLVDSALGPIPDGWGTDPFDVVASFVNGFAFKPSHWGPDGRPIIKIKELKAGITAGTPRCPEGPIDKKYWVEGGDLLMSWSADLGVYLWADEPGLLNQHLFVVRPSNDSVTLLYLLHALDNAMPEFRARAQGTTMKHIKRAALHEVSALIAPPMLLARFDQVVGPIHEESTTLQAQTRYLRAMRDLLLPKLVSGQIDVSALDLDALVGEQVA
ncbi:restriction endonuclease subunit S [Mycolicibacterium sp. Y3]